MRRRASSDARWKSTTIGGPTGVALFVAAMWRRCTGSEAVPRTGDQRECGTGKVWQVDDGIHWVWIWIWTSGCGRGSSGRGDSISYLLQRVGIPDGIVFRREDIQITRQQRSSSSSGSTVSAAAELEMNAAVGSGVHQGEHVRMAEETGVDTEVGARVVGGADDIHIAVRNRMDVGEILKESENGCIVDGGRGGRGGGSEDANNVRTDHRRVAQ